MIWVAASCPNALRRSNNSKPTSEGDPSAETWSVSRTSNLFLVGLLRPILAAEPLGFPRYLVVGHGANGAAPILLDRPQLEDLCGQLRDLLLEVFHPAFKCLRHAGKIDQCSREFHNEMPSCLDLESLLRRSLLTEFDPLRKDCIGPVLQPRESR